jgi:hypothetical protein
MGVKCRVAKHMHQFFLPRVGEYVEAGTIVDLDEKEFTLQLKEGNVEVLNELDQKYIGVNPDSKKDENYERINQINDLKRREIEREEENNALKKQLFEMQKKLESLESAVIVETKKKGGK